MDCFKDSVFAVTDTSSGGLTKRELFAAMFMQSILGNQLIDAFKIGEHVVTNKAIELADTLIKRLEEK
jgi:hypothetical protein